jgi:hypothetical protein
MKRSVILGTVGVAAAGSLLSMVVSPGVIAAAATKAQEVLVTNGDEHPVPTKAIGSTAVTGTVDIAGTPKVHVTNLPAAAAAPLWQGTPYLSTLRLHQAGCEAPSPIPAGHILYVQRAVTRFMTLNDPHVSAGVQIAPHGSAPAYSQLVPIPTSMRSNSSEVAGYDGSVEIGLPATAATACINFSPVSEPASITIIGYLILTP